MSAITSVSGSYIPSTQDGYLPLFVLFVGVTAIGNVVQCYTTLEYTQRIYTPPSPSSSIKSSPQDTSSALKSNSKHPTSPATPLSARTFGTWNLAVGLARIIASYHMSERSWYTMSLLTNVVGLWHFGTEAFVYKTCKTKGPWLAPVCVAVVGVIWHLTQWENYVKK